MRTGSFDYIAPAYDQLASFIYGDAILESHHAFLKEIAPAESILILGGGTGEIIPALVQQNPSARIVFIDASKKMVEIALKRPGAEKVEFIIGTENDIPDGIQFEAILTFFYLDLFEDLRVSEVVSVIKRYSASEAIWLSADFADRGKWWHRVVLKVMYLFFRFSAGVRVSKLPDWKNHLEMAGFQCVRYKLFKKGFIESACFKRQHSIE